MEQYTNIHQDMQAIEDIFSDIELPDLCAKLDMTETEYLNIKNEEVEPTKEQLENIYNFAYNKGLYLNEIAWQDALDFYRKPGVEVVSHGARTYIKGAIRLDVSGDSNDFSDGFYMGQNISQGGMFVCDEPNSKRVQKIAEKVNNCDYVLAPIADNKMFEVIDAFSDREITDLQCLYALSATHLGYQYVLKTPECLNHVDIREHMYFCSVEKSLYNKQSDVETNTSMNKALLAKKKYAGEGKYIDEILKV